MTDVINKGLFTTCNIVCTYYVKSSDGITKDKFKSGGAGVFYTVDKENGDALIITNFHVLYNTSAQTENNIISQIEIFLYGDTYFLTPIQATYIGGSATYDLALIEVKGSEEIKKSFVTKSVFGDSNDLNIGETVLAIGNPGTDGTSVTKGSINVPYEQVVIENALEKEVNMRVIRYDAAVNPGNSGGGLFNAKGELIGIVNAKYVKSNYDGIGYAIPSNLVKLVVENIINYCYGVENEKVRKPYFGIYTKVAKSTTVFNESKNRYDVIETIVVDSFEEGSALANRLRAGDVINSYKYAGKTYAVTHLYDISEMLFMVGVGDILVLNVTGTDNLDRSISVTITQGYLKYVD